MKLKSLLFCTVLGAAISTSAFAANRPAPEAENVISEFAVSHMNNDTKRLSKIISSDVLLRFCKGNEVLSQSHVSILKLMRQNEGIRQNCSTAIHVLASSDAIVMARVDFVYKDFVIENYLTIELGKNDKWKITRINKFFTEKSSPQILSNS